MKKLIEEYFLMYGIMYLTMIVLDICSLYFFKHQTSIEWSKILLDNFITTTIAILVIIFLDKMTKNKK